MSGDAVNLAGRLSLGELGALCEVADLYVGNDTGPTHVAAAVGCATLAIFGPSDPARSAPFATKGRVIVLGGEAEPYFSGWQETALPAEAMAAVVHFLADFIDRGTRLW
jgi:ADP-heptose:LPS heptosyltransferase